MTRKNLVITVGVVCAAALIWGLLVRAQKAKTAETALMSERAYQESLALTEHVEQMSALTDVANRQPTFDTPIEQLLKLPVNDPRMTAASQTVALIIVVNNHLCARVSNVAPVSGATFDVTCVMRRDGSGSASYRVDVAANSAMPL